MFQIDISQEAEGDINKLPKKDVEIILKKLYSIRENPLHFVERLAGLSFWKLRIRDYRTILQINTDQKKILVVKIGYRKNIYKN